MSDMDYRAMFDREYIGAWDLVGKDVTVKIVKVEARKLKSQRGEDKKPVIWFEGAEKAFVCNKTNARTIAALYGNDTTQWLGKRITLYATTTSAGGETVDCIRVRTQAPRAATRAKPIAPPPPSEPVVDAFDPAPLPVSHPDAVPPDDDEVRS